MTTSLNYSTSEKPALLLPAFCTILRQYLYVGQFTHKKHYHRSAYKRVTTSYVLARMWHGHRACEIIALTVANRRSGSVIPHTHRPMPTLPKCSRLDTGHAYTNAHNPTLHTPIHADMTKCTTTQSTHHHHRRRRCRCRKLCTHFCTHPSKIRRKQANQNIIIYYV